MSWERTEDRLNGEERMIRTEGRGMSVEDVADTIPQERVQQMLANTPGLKDAIEKKDYPTSMSDSGDAVTSLAERFGVGEEDIIATALYLKGLH